MIGSLLTYTFNYPAETMRHAGKPDSLYYLWSLSVEEQFYLLWPPIVLALRGRKRILFAVTLLIIATGNAQQLFNIFPALTTYNYTGLINRMGSLGIGAAGAVWVSMRPLSARFFNNSVVEAVILLLLAASLTIPFRYRYALMAPCSRYLVLKASHFDFRTGAVEWLLTHRRIVWKGSISYGIYLFHVPVGVIINEHVFDYFWNAVPFDQFGRLEKFRWHSWVLKFPIYSATTIGLAAASYKWFESPILSLKDRWFPNRPVDVSRPSNIET